MNQTTKHKMAQLSPRIHSSSKRSITYKRAFDIIVSLLVSFFILSWLIPILAVLIKLNSRGPVFFIQKRMGTGSETFDCLKLRTMVINEKANSCQAQENDPRITSVGKFLRLTCLDELPQFFNVLKGEMSIVGPRPHMIKDCNDFIGVIPNYGLRHSVKPGITGMAQVKGYRGRTTSFYDIFHRYQWDIFYVRNASFALDMRIIYKTLLQIISSFTKIARSPLNFKKKRSAENQKPVDAYRDDLVEA